MKVTINELPSNCKIKFKFEKCITFTSENVPVEYCQWSPEECEVSTIQRT